MRAAIGFTFGMILTAIYSSGLVSADDLKQKFMPSGVTAKVGGYRPNRAEMDKEADIVSTAPDGLESPKYGKIEIGEKSWAFVLDEPEGKPAKLYIDTNADGDLTNDPLTKWEPQTRDDVTMYRGTGQIDLGDGKIGTLGLYRFDPNDKPRAALKNTLLFYTDYGYELSFQLDGKEFSTVVAGNVDSAESLPIDRDGNGRISYHFEHTKVGEPFNFTGTTYVFSLKDGELSLDKAPDDQVVDLMPMPPDLSIGKPALAFTAETLDGKSVDFPKHYAGKIVMLDFWATWCGPCVGEIPNVKEAYKQWHDKGFEILGISFDREGMADKLNEFLKDREMTWSQIYEGKFWDTSLGTMYDVSGIPFVLLVDGDSGEILATAKELRGSGLADFIGQQLERKNGKSSSAGSDENKSPDK